MDMSNSMAELVDPEIYDTISQRPATNAEFAEPVKPSEAQDDSQRHAALDEWTPRHSEVGQAQVPFREKKSATRHKAQRVRIGP
jgi:hypothetical protein